MEQQKEDTPAFMGFVMWTKASDIPADAFLHIATPKATLRNHHCQEFLLHNENWKPLPTMQKV